MEITKENWTNLLNYYISCLQRESDSQLTFFESGKNEKFFTPFGSENLFTQREGSNEIAVNSNTLFNNYLQKNKTSNIAYYYGYPLIRISKLSGKGNAYTSISPIFYSEIKISNTGNRIKIDIMENVPNVNESLLKELDMSYEEIDSFSDLFATSMIDEDNKGSLTGWLVNIIDDLTKLISIDLYSPINIEQFNHNFPGYNDKNNYIINEAIIYASETQSYHSSVIRELEYLKHENSYSRMKDTALYPILKQKHENRVLVDKNLVLCAETNRSQMEAVQSALSNSLTVVSGPPGTGKSQVVLNAITSLIARKETGLLVSKTNAAVSIISDYFNNNFDYPVVLRTGNKAIKTEAIQFLDDVSKGSYYEQITTEKVLESNKAYNKTYEEVFKEDLALKEKYKLSDEMAELSEEFLIIRKKVDENGFQWIKNVRLELNTINNIIDQVSKYINLINEKIADSKKKLYIKAIKSIYNLFTNTRKRDIVKDIARFEKRIGYFKIINDTASFESILEHLLELKQILTLLYVFNKLEKIKTTIEKLPVIEDVVALFEKNEHEIIKKGREHITNLRKQTISKMNFTEKQNFKDFVDVQKQLLNYNTGSGFVQLKRKEEQLFPQVRQTFPIWITTSLSAKNSMFPLEAGIFDLLIIDEASQCDIASMIPLLYRAKRSCIIGDINQFSHIVTFNQNTDRAIAKQNKIKDDDLFYLSYRQKSIYEIAERALSSEAGFSKLDEHYRSHPQIIKFSNDNFYGRHLKVYTNPSKLAFNPGDSAVEWVDIAGEVSIPKTGSALNKNEAEKVWEKVIELMKYFFKQEKYISIGIATPLRAHREYLNTLFAKKINTLSNEDRIIYESYTNHSVPFIIDTAYKFQGNERDVIIFSTVASIGMKPGTYSFINERRQLNVAITRARTKLIIIGNKEFCKENGGYLGKLADYADGLQVKGYQQQEIKLQSPIEKLLYEKMLAIGLQPEPQYSELGFNLDFAILNNGKKIAIECNGLSTHKAMDGNVRRDDTIRKRKLINAGWKVFIFWSWDILQNAEGCAREVENYLENGNI